MLGKLYDDGKSKYDFTVANRFLESIKLIPSELKNKKTWFYSMKPFKRLASKEEIETSKYKNVKLFTNENNPFKQYTIQKGKNPCNMLGKSISHTDKANFKSFDEVIKYNPLGLYHSFHLNNEYICIDLDCAYGEDWQLYNWAELIVNYFKNTYIEKSVSGKGIHIIYKNSDMKDLNLSCQINKVKFNFCALPDKCKVEIFSNRPIILTGDVINNPKEIEKTNSNLKSFIKSLGFTNKYIDKVSKEAKKRKIDTTYNDTTTVFNKIYKDSENDNDVFEFIKYKVDIREILEHYNIKYSSNNILCPLPEHSEKNPSFRVYDFSNSFYCFSCKKGGSVIDFVMEMESIDNPLIAAKKINEILNLKINFDFEVDPDFKKVKWNKDFVLVTYKNEEGEQITDRLSVYNNKYKNVEEKPKMSKLNVLQVKENIERLLSHYSHVLKFNIVKENYDIFKNNELENYNLDYFLNEVKDMTIKHGQRISKEKILDSLKNIGLMNKYNPIEEYLIKARKYYLNNPDDTIFHQLADTIISDSTYKNKFISKFLLQMVWMICCKDESGLASQFVLVLQGPQGIGKTTWFKNLLPKQFRHNYFLGGRCFDLNNKDHIIETFDNWLVEMGEIASTFRKADQENLKNFITAHQDKIRRPYGSEAVLKKRRTSLCATTNDMEYLRDLTGNRRFLTLPCSNIEWKKQNELDLDMLWGFIYDKYLQGVNYAFDQKEINEIINFNKEFLNKPESLMVLEEKFILNPEIDEGDNWMTAKEIFDNLDYQTIIPTHFKLGKELKRFSVNSKRNRVKGTLFNVRLKTN